MTVTEWKKRSNTGKVSFLVEECGMQRVRAFRLLRKAKDINDIYKLPLAVASYFEEYDPQKHPEHNKMLTLSIKV
ncbi:hypothetical protein KAR91_42270 [Candidatus Pacearchaeota archaeon]|nr:hypothetical protein [Candidatus Pacearchaeota archaeon]